MRLIKITFHEYIIDTCFGKCGFGALHPKFHVVIRFSTTGIAPDLGYFLLLRYSHDFT